MEYLIFGIIAIVIFILLIVIVKVEKIRNRANALFLEAEKYWSGMDKMHEVATSLYYSRFMPSIAKFFISEEAFEVILQKIYDKTRKAAKDILDDGEFNHSID